MRILLLWTTYSRKKGYHNVIYKEERRKGGKEGRKKGGREREREYVTTLYLLNREAFSKESTLSSRREYRKREGPKRPVGAASKDS